MSVGNPQVERSTQAHEQKTAIITPFNTVVTAEWVKILSTTVKFCPVRGNAV
jgi:hypothetical protein